MEKATMLKICTQVSKDCERDAQNFDGQPFTGKTVGEYFGNHGAAINALAEVLKALIEKEVK